MAVRAGVRLGLRFLNRNLEMPVSTCRLARRRWPPKGSHEKFYSDDYCPGCHDGLRFVLKFGEWPRRNGSFRWRYGDKFARRKLVRWCSHHGGERRVECVRPGNGGCRGGWHLSCRRQSSHGRQQDHGRCTRYRGCCTNGRNSSWNGWRGKRHGWQVVNRWANGNRWCKVGHGRVDRRGWRGRYRRGRHRRGRQQDRWGVIDRGR